MDYLKAESCSDKPVSTSQIISYLNSINISYNRRALYRDMELLIKSGASIVKTELGRENAYYSIIQALQHTFGCFQRISMKKEKAKYS